MQEQIQKLCKFIVDLTASEKTLVGAIIVQTLWMIIGTLTHLDPPPFTLMLTISNVVQLILIFVIAVAQKQGQNDVKSHVTSNVELHAKMDSMHKKLDNIHSKFGLIKLKRSKDSKVE